MSHNTTAEATTATKRSDRPWYRADWVTKLVSITSLLAIWEFLVRNYAPPFVARPAAIIQSIVPTVTNPRFQADALATGRGILQGLVIAVVLGVVVGAVLGRAPRASMLIRNWIFMFYAAPLVAILPLFVMWFGYSSANRLAVVIWSAFFPIALNTADGMANVPSKYLEVATSFRSRRRDTMFDVIIPASLPYLLAGFRLGAGRAILGAVVLEFLIGMEGIGFFILINGQRMRHNTAMVGVLILSIAGILIWMFSDSLTRRLAPWYLDARN
jgi:ABC-type nitrate/sulfonate/bicarbonate transport system permease component